MNGCGIELNGSLEMVILIEYQTILILDSGSSPSEYTIYHIAAMEKFNARGASHHLTLVDKGHICYSHFFFLLFRWTIQYFFVLCCEILTFLLQLDSKAQEENHNRELLELWVTHLRVTPINGRHPLPTPLFLGLPFSITLPQQLPEGITHKKEV